MEELVSVGFGLSQTWRTYDWCDGADNDLVQAELFVLARKLAEKLIKVVLEAPEHILGTHRLFAMCFEGPQQVHSFDLLLADALDAGKHSLHARDLALLRLDEVANAVLLLGEVSAPLFDAGALFGKGAERRGKSRAQESEVVPQFRQAGRIGGTGTKSWQRRQGLVWQLQKDGSSGNRPFPERL